MPRRSRQPYEVTGSRHYGDLSTGVFGEHKLVVLAHSQSEAGG